MNFLAVGLHHNSQGRANHFRPTFVSNGKRIRTSLINQGNLSTNG